MLGVYQSWGFRSSPFETRPLPASPEGKNLLIGREVELQKIFKRLLSPNKIVTVEGPNGIGKTSVNNVAAFMAFESYLEGTSDQLLVPCEKVFQIRTDINLDEFINNVFLHVGLTLVKHADTLRQSGRGSDKDGSIAAWLKSPTFNAVSLQVSGFNIGGIGASTGTSGNNSTGFAKAGFHDLIRNWLLEIFPNGEGGGVVCVIDNLELLRESEAARKALESLRDEILTTIGLRWIICGSIGIVRTIAATPRIQGFLHAPIEIGDIDAMFAGNILKSRTDVYRATDQTYLPIIADDFKHLFEILHGNIRDTLSAADDFCNWVSDEGTEYQDEAMMSKQFRAWLKNECLQRLAAAQGIVSTRPWKLFHDIVNVGGQCSPGAFKDFGFETSQGMRSQIIKLEAANLVKSVRDEEDNRRKTILLTSGGWMVEYARRTGLNSLFPDQPDEPEPDQSKD